MAEVTGAARFPPLMPANNNLDEAQLAAYEYTVDITEKTYRGTIITTDVDGSVQGPFNLLLYTPTISEPWCNYQLAVARLLAPSEAEAAVLGVLSITKAVYGIYAHTIISMKVGYTEEQVKSMLAGTCPSDITPRQKAVYELAIKLAQTRGPLDAESYDQAFSVLGQAGVTGAIHQSAAFMNASIMLNAADARLPPSVSSG